MTRQRLPMARPNREEGESWDGRPAPTYASTNMSAPDPRRGWWEYPQVIDRAVANTLTEGYSDKVIAAAHALIEPLARPRDRISLPGADYDERYQAHLYKQNQISLGDSIHHPKLHGTGKIIGTVLQLVAGGMALKGGRVALKILSGSRAPQIFPSRNPPVVNNARPSQTSNGRAARRRR